MLLFAEKSQLKVVIPVPFEVVLIFIIQSL